MASALVELEALKEATRVRLTPEVAKALRDEAEDYMLLGDKQGRQMGQGLTVLLDMHDKLETIRHGG